MLYQCINIGGHVAYVIIGDIFRLIRLAVSTLVDGNGPKVFAEFLNLMSPAVPKFGKAVDEDNEGLFRVAFFDVVKLNAL